MGEAHETVAKMLEEIIEGRMATIYHDDLAEAAALIRSLSERVGVLEADRDELQHVFDMQWEAGQRAINRWQQAHPGNDLVWPDRADLVVWLMGQLEHYQRGWPSVALSPQKDR